MLVKAIANLFLLAASAAHVAGRPMARRDEIVSIESTSTAAPASSSPLPDVQIMTQASTSTPQSTMAGTPPVAAAPSTAAPAAGDLFILNYALTLEHLESTFYEQALAKFQASDFSNAGFDPALRDQFMTVHSHEATHVTALQSVINGTFGAGKAVPPCEYNFAFDTVSGFVATAAALERTGVQAYTGALKFVQADAIKTAAATIATVEGRHSAALNVVGATKVNGVLQNINPIPAPFDTPLGFTPVFSIAAPFIKSCPFALPVVPFPSLSLSKPVGTYDDTVGLLFTAVLTEDMLNTPGALKCAIVYGLAQSRSDVVISTDARSGGRVAECKMPAGATGFQELMVFIVNKDMDVTLDNDKHVIAGPTTFSVLEDTKVKVQGSNASN
ncbi:hypothetical protein HKX48_001515 [Thoreauomyces humboldtii]|nr:hypothetical protein HKX48_001515 [Thoreauomyces humboldtii]